MHGCLGTLFPGRPRIHRADIAKVSEPAARIGYDGSMSEPVAFLNGEIIPARNLCMPVDDAGFVLGATVTEQLRTFGGRLFQLAEHLARLRESLEIVEVEPPVSWRVIGEAAEQIATRNYRLLPDGADLGLTIFVTPGPYAPLAEGRSGGPLVAMHTFCLPFGRWAALYGRGCRLVTTAVEQIPAQCWPQALKCRSRMHYYLADLAAQKRDPGARAILLDQQGRVTETSTANVIAYRAHEGLVSPTAGTVLGGISLKFVQMLADQLDIPAAERDMSLDDLSTADEVLLSSTPNCLLPAVQLNGAPIGDGAVGTVFRKLMRAWSDAVGVDVVAQAQRFAAV